MPSDAPTIDYRQLLEERAAPTPVRVGRAWLRRGAADWTTTPNFADSSQVTAERGEAEVLAGQLRETLDEVALALGRLEDGSYGRCEVCGEAIQPARLEAMPATRFCINHASRP